MEDLSISDLDFEAAAKIRRIAGELAEAMSEAQARGLKIEINFRPVYWQHGQKPRASVDVDVKRVTRF